MVSPGHGEGSRRVCRIVSALRASLSRSALMDYLIVISGYAVKRSTSCKKRASPLHKSQRTDWRAVGQVAKLRKPDPCGIGRNVKLVLYIGD